MRIQFLDWCAFQISNISTWDVFSANERKNLEYAHTPDRRTQMAPEYTQSLTCSGAHFDFSTTALFGPTSMFLSLPCLIHASCPPITSCGDNINILKSALCSGSVLGRNALFRMVVISIFSDKLPSCFRPHFPIPM